MTIHGSEEAQRQGNSEPGEGVSSVVFSWTWGAWRRAWPGSCGKLRVSVPKARRTSGSRSHLRAPAETEPAARKSHTIIFRAGLSAASFGSGDRRGVRSLGAGDRRHSRRSTKEPGAGRVDVQPPARGGAAASPARSRIPVLAGITEPTQTRQSLASPGLRVEEGRYPRTHLLPIDVILFTPVDCDLPQGLRAECKPG